MCGQRVYLTSGWLNTCECGRDFNGSGQLLAAREHWGEETGERWQDLVNLSENWELDEEY